MRRQRDPGAARRAPKPGALSTRSFGERDVSDKPFFVKARPPLDADKAAKLQRFPEKRRLASVVDADRSVADLRRAEEPANSTTRSWCSPPTMAGWRPLSPRQGGSVRGGARAPGRLGAAQGPRRVGAPARRPSHRERRSGAHPARHGLLRRGAIEQVPGPGWALLVPLLGAVRMPGLAIEPYILIESRRATRDTPFQAVANHPATSMRSTPASPPRDVGQVRPAPRHVSSMTWTPTRQLEPRPAAPGSRTASVRGPPGGKAGAAARLRA